MYAIIRTDGRTDDWTNEWRTDGFEFKDVK